MTTITASTTLGIDLNPVFYTSPVAIDAGVTISNPSYPYAVYRHSGSTTFFAIENNGTISSTSGIGVYLDPGGSVTNAASASIVGGVYAVKIAGGSGTVINAGNIAGGTKTGIGLLSGGTVTNGGGIVGHDGVLIKGGTGTVFNNGQIVGVFYGYGVAISGVGVVVNEGSIYSNGGAGVSLGSGGTVTNAAGASLTSKGASVRISGGVGTLINDGMIASPVVLAAGGLVTNAVSAAIEVAHSFYDIEIGNAGSVVNDGSIGSNGSDAAPFYGLSLPSGGSVANRPGATIESNYIAVLISNAAGTVVNGGSIAGTGINSVGAHHGSEGARLASGGSVTNAVSASITGFSFGVDIRSLAGTVVNDGNIAATGTSGIGFYQGPTVRTGVYLGYGGLVTNAASASITGSLGILVRRSPGTVINDGNIAGTGIGSPGFGVALDSGGAVSNAAAGSITGSDLGGVSISGGAGMVVNQGSITGTGSNSAGVYLGSGGSVTNAASGSMTGGNPGGVVITAGVGTVVNDGSIAGIGATAFGINLASGGMLTNAGTIIGNGGTAVAFGGTGSNLLVLDAGCGFSGIVSGGTSSSNTLELASTTSAGTVTGLGTQVIHFGSITFDTGAQWSVTGIQRGLAGTISGFAAGDTIELTGVTATGSSFVGSVLTLDEAIGFATLDLPGPFTLTSFDVTNNAGGAEVTLACFCAGARLLTVAGEMPVEDLAPGDVLVTSSGRLRPVRWIGLRRVEAVRHSRPQDVCPVRVQAHAFGPDVPHRSLHLSPDHAVFVGGALIPVRHLCNGATVRQEAATAVSYFHVELDGHDILLAEGLLAESYLDTGNRGAFAEPTRLEEGCDSIKSQDRCACLIEAAPRPALSA